MLLFFCLMVVRIIGVSQSFGDLTEMIILDHLGIEMMMMLAVTVCILLRIDAVMDVM